MHNEENTRTDLITVLFAACSGNLSTLRSAHEDGVDLNAGDYDKRTALHLACAEQHMDCIKFLVEEAEVELDPKDKWGDTPKDNAYQSGFVEVANYLSKKISIKSHEKIVKTMKLLMLACNGDLEGLKKLHQQGVDLNMSDYDQRTALHLACAEKHVHCVEFLVNIGVKLDIQDRWGQTPAALELLQNEGIVVKKEERVILVKHEKDSLNKNIFKSFSEKNIVDFCTNKTIFI